MELPNNDDNGENVSLEQTINLLRIIGSPFAGRTQFDSEDCESRRLYHLAQKNRMGLLYLTALKELKCLKTLRKLYDDQYQKSLGTYGAIARASMILQGAGIMHAVFKTLRPYPATTVDIDILILDTCDYEKSVEALIHAGYRKLGSGPNSTTVEDPSIGMGVDLYREIAVSQIVYLDKNKIRSAIIEKRIDSMERDVQTLSPNADLLALIAHSVVKEHMYTLSEYYSTIYFLAQMSEKDLEDFVNMIYGNSVVNAARVHLGITAKLHETSHGMIPKKILSVLHRIGMDSLELSRMPDETGVDAPFKFHPLTVIKSLVEKATREEKARKSIARQLASMTNLSFAGSVTKNILVHVRREMY